MAENHINVITVNCSDKTIAQKEAILNNVFDKLNNLDSQYLNSITGNTQLSATELGHLIPV